jgi:hypothetical protein
VPAEPDLVGIERRPAPEKLGNAVGGALYERRTTTARVDVLSSAGWSKVAA